MRLLQAKVTEDEVRRRLESQRSRITERRGASAWFSYDTCVRTVLLYLATPNQPFLSITTIAALKSHLQEWKKLNKGEGLNCAPSTMIATMCGMKLLQYRNEEISWWDTGVLRAALNLPVPDLPGPLTSTITSLQPRQQEQPSSSSQQPRPSLSQQEQPSASQQPLPSSSRQQEQPSASQQPLPSSSRQPLPSLSQQEPTSSSQQEQPLPPQPQALPPPMKVKDFIKAGKEVLSAHPKRVSMRSPLEEKVVRAKISHAYKPTAEQLVLCGGKEINEKLRELQQCQTLAMFEEYMHWLLWTEEEAEIEEHLMEAEMAVPVRAETDPDLEDFYTLEYKVDEKRAELVQVGGRVAVAVNRQRWDATIHKIEPDESMLVHLDPVFKTHHPETAFVADFVVPLHQRRGYAIRHRAIERIKDRSRPLALLLPGAVRSGNRKGKSVLVARSKEGLQEFKKSLNNPQLDDEQLTVVWRMVKGKAGVNTPYLVQGPPGTGKSTTIAAVVRAWLKEHPQQRVLICAPSNKAVNAVLEKLAATFDKEKMFRVVGQRHGQDAVESDNRIVKEYGGYDKDADEFEPLESVGQYQVILATLVGSFDVPAKPGDFGLIIVDEAGQATVPQILIPLFKYQTGSISTQVMLVGDHMQLGPTVKAPSAARFGLGVSLLELLMRSAQYQAKDDLYNLRLVNNYRSHPAIIKFPSDEWYESSLRACARRDITSRGLGLSFLQKQGFPIMVDNVVGEESQMPGSTSWSNEAEATRVCYWIRQLARERCPTGGIGVITPYTDQTKIITEKLRAMNITDVIVASVDGFQGGERDVIIITTVRTTTEGLRFINDERRTNVVLARATALEIVVCNEAALTGGSGAWHDFLQWWHSIPNWSGSSR
ncbi:P-loop containing nucleoside triphosphate hydrolase protein [Gaertneriomyces semiglobifer]|nr:P-loop containing nucleoside triphosphate hydrolase protein [Gaertneriomyces semiglobifer]